MSRCLMMLLLLLGSAHGGNVRCVCSPSECDEISDSDCPAGSGLVWDPCGCCKLCSRLEFEACGGPDGFHGSCAAGLECVVGQAGTALDRANLEGTCMRVASAAEAAARCGGDARSVRGCNIVEAHCRCQERQVCPGDAAPFSFVGPDECEINLAVILAQQQASESGGWVEVAAGGCQVADAGVVVRHGDTWWSEDRCTECHCKNGALECQNSHCASCLNPHYLPGHCCPVCHESDILPQHCTWIDGCALKCRHGLRRDNDGCFRCECHHVEGEGCPLQCPGDRYATDAEGKPMCECASKSPPVTTASPALPCTDGGVTRSDGEEWSDGCRQCACSKGVAMCSLMACPRCPGATVTLPGECCPRCNGSSSEAAGLGSSACQSADGAVRQLGSRWRLDAACAWCECRSGGQVLCGAEACPPAACDAPVTGECCPRCMASPHRPPPDTPACPETRVEGEAWREDACNSCLCLKGRSVCFEETCQAAACAFPITVKGRCCPVCHNASLAVPSVCISGNVTYGLGETWWRGACVQCTCRESGRVVCSPHCDTPAPPGHCCPACPKDTGARALYWGHYQTATIVLATLLLFVLVVVPLAWCRWHRTGGSGTPWCCAGSKVRGCKSPTAPAYAAYNPVKHCDSELQQTSEQRSSFVGRV